jgi:subtilisin family serine protease
VEQLEERCLLAFDAVAFTALLDDPISQRSAGVADSLDSIPSLIDRGDFYWADGRQIKLYRRTDELLVGLHSGTDPVAFASRLQSTLPGLQGAIHTKPTLHNGLLRLSPESGGITDLDRALAGLANISGVDWAAPVFVNGESGLRQWLTDEIVVRLNGGVDRTSFFADGRFGSHRSLAGFDDQFVVEVVGGGLAGLNLANALSTDERLAWAAPNTIDEIVPALVPDDTLFSSQWHLNNTGQTGAATDADVDAVEAWSTNVGSSDIVIAVLDDGVQLDHPDLPIYVNPGEIEGNGVDDDGNGIVDDTKGWDFNNNPSYTSKVRDPSPLTTFDNHGTSVAGVAAAATDNGLGVAGASFGSRIMSLKVGNNDGMGHYDPAITADKFAEAVYYAAGRGPGGQAWRGADVMNMSLTWSSSTMLTTALDWAATNGRDGKGTPIFAATGNGASGYASFAVGFQAGNFIAEWRYKKDGTSSAGDDTAWLAGIRFPDGSMERFDSPGMPAGWSSTGSAMWSVADDPAHSYGTGRYVAKAGTIGNSQNTRLRSPSFAGGGDLLFRTWVSSELNFDGLELWVSGDGGNSFAQIDLNPANPASMILSGVPTITSNVSHPASLASTIAVGASTDFDYRADYSQYGAATDFVAPSGGGLAGITTTDRTGSAGYNTAGGSSGNYTSTVASAFSGTSSATPLAAGVGALLLARNPSLTAAQVRQIMRDSAEQIGGVTYDGNGFNEFYGYGRINAAAALAITPGHVFVTQTGGATDVAESGATDTYTLRLPSIPNGPVQVTITADSQTEVSINGVDFASSQDWDFVNASPATITVRAIDDLVVEGSHTSTITHAISGTVFDPNYPLDLVIDPVVANVADNELSAFARLAPLGGLVFVSDDNSGILSSGADEAEIVVAVEGGQTISAIVEPASGVLLNVELVGVTGTFTSAAAGEPAVLPPTYIAADGSYTLRITGSGATLFELAVFRNAALEAGVGDTSDGNELAIDGSFLSLGSGRYAVMGSSDPVQRLEFTKSSNPGAFVDISGTGTPLALGDDNEANITTTVGNAIFPAGTVTVGNNGGIIAGGSAELHQNNEALPTSLFGKALLPFWDDMDSETGNVYWQQLLVGGINTLIVQWENRPHFNNVGSATFQLQLFESGPILARYAYEDVNFGNAFYDFGASATIGYQESSGSAVQFSHNEATIANGDQLLMQYVSADVDEYEIDLTGKTGERIDIVLAGINGANYEFETLELLDTNGTTVLRTGVFNPLHPGVNAANYDLGILDFVVPHDGVYTLRFTTDVAGEYIVVVTDPLSFDTEPNNSAGSPLRDLTATRAALGHLNAVGDQNDFYEIQLALNESVAVSTQTTFDSASTTPLNDLNPELQVIHPNGSTIVGNDLDSLDGKNARVSFSAPVAGLYKIRVRATSGAGEYLLQVAPAPLLAGDYNDDGSVNAADYVLFRKYVGTSQSLPNDPLGGQIGPAQHAQWAANFGEMLGAGSGAGKTDTATALAEPVAVLDVHMAVSEKLPHVAAADRDADADFGLWMDASRGQGAGSGDSLTLALSQREREGALTLALSQREREGALTLTLSQRETEGALAWLASRRPDAEEQQAVGALIPRGLEEASSPMQLDALDSAFEKLLAVTA